MTAYVNPYTDPRWRAVRLQALRRDGWRCVFCGADLRGKGRSRVDHIVPWKKDPRLAFSVANLRCICVNCDAKRHAEKGRAGGQEPIEIGLDGLPASWR